MNEIEFRGISTIRNKWYYGDLLRYGSYTSIRHYVHEEPFGSYLEEIVEPETVGQYTGLKDKHGVKIFEGDVIRYKKPYRTTQTHTGDNIPNGSYTEPMEPSIEIIESEVLFNDGMFTCEDGDRGFNTPLSWVNNEWTLEEIKYAISWRDNSDEWFFDRDEGDLWYLIEEVAKVKDENELIEYLSGLEVIGTIHQNPELLQQ